MELQRWTSIDPENTRCEFELNNGNQCCNKRVPETTRCPLHGANMQLAQAEHKSLRMYRLAKFQKRADELTDHTKIKSLREEIAILRMILEERITRCDSAHDLILQSGPISDLVMKVERVVTSCQKLENQLGDMLDAQKVKNLATILMQTLSDKLNEFADAHNLESELISLLLEAVANAFLEQIKNES